MNEIKIKKCINEIKRKKKNITRGLMYERPLLKVRVFLLHDGGILNHC